MKYIEVKNSNNEEPVNLAYSDHGKGKPVILIHGWPLSKEMWEYQEEALINAGFRVITYDRRGFGKSDKPWDNYDYDTLAGDLKAVIDQLDLRNVTLVGFSMGGGEVARYFGKYGGAGVTKVVLVSSILPFLAKTADNKDGVPAEKFDEQIAQINNDRIGFLDEFGKQFFGVGIMSHPLSTPLLDYYRMLCSLASPRATRQCHNAFAFTDFRNDTAKINVPTLIIHGDEDKIVPIAISADKASSYIPVKQYLVYEGAPHGLFYTHKDRFNNDLVEFITTGVVKNNTEETILVPGDENSIPVF